MQLNLFTPESSSGKMSQGPSHLITEQTSGKSSTRWQTSGRWTSSGECWMHSGMESPSADAVSLSSLASILETQVDPKYFLSERACAGILRRAAKRGKTLPAPLEVALEAVAGRPTPTQ